MIWPHLVCLLHKKDSFYQDFDSTSVVFLRPWAARHALVCSRFEGVDRKEAAWRGLQTEIFRAREAGSR